MLTPRTKVWPAIMWAMLLHFLATPFFNCPSFPSNSFMLAVPPCYHLALQSEVVSFSFFSIINKCTQPHIIIILTSWRHKICLYSSLIQISILLNTLQTIWSSCAPYVLQAHSQMSNIGLGVDFYIKKMYLIKSQQNNVHHLMVTHTHTSLPLLLCVWFPRSTLTGAWWDTDNNWRVTQLVACCSRNVLHASSSSSSPCLPSDARCTSPNTKLKKRVPTIIWIVRIVRLYDINEQILMVYGHNLSVQIRSNPDRRCRDNGEVTVQKFCF